MSCLMMHILYSSFNDIYQDNDTCKCLRKKCLSAYYHSLKKYTNYYLDIMCIRNTILHVASDHAGDCADSRPNFTRSRNYLSCGQQKSVRSAIAQFYRIRVFYSGNTLRPIIGRP